MDTVRLEKHEISALGNIFEERLYNTSAELFYEGHIPHVGYILLDGNVILGKKRKVKSELSPGTVIGVKELMTNTPVSYFARIYSGSKVFILDRSSLKSLNQKQDPHLRPLIDKITTL